MSYFLNFDLFSVLCL